jgi:hypothetical protein
MLDAKRYAPMNARDKMPFEVTPIFFKLQRYESAQAAPAAVNPAANQPSASPTASVSAPPAVAPPAVAPPAGSPPPAAQDNSGQPATPPAQPQAADQANTPPAQPQGADKYAGAARSCAAEPAVIYSAASPRLTHHVLLVSTGDFPLDRPVLHLRS